MAGTTTATMFTTALVKGQEFITISDIVESQRKDLFAILDHEDEASNYFIMKCNEYGKDVVVNARDKRKDSEGRTLLHSCCMKGLIIGVAFLIGLEHDVNCIDSSTTKVTPLFEAITSKNLEIATMLIRAGADIQYQDRNGENCLHFAARSGSARMVEVLVKSSALPPTEVQLLAAVPNIKRKFPEDLTVNALTKSVLVDYRAKGVHISVAGIKDQKREERRQMEASKKK